MVAVKLFKIRQGERTFRRLDEGDAIRLTESLDDIITIGFSGIFAGDVIIGGDLTVNGTNTTINSITHDINDNVIVLNEGEVGAGVVTLGTVSGFEVDRGTLNNNVRWVWDEVIDKFRGEFVTSGLIAAVEVDQLMFTDHGSNAQMWSIEEDSNNPTNALVFDYSGTERLRITPSGDIADSNDNVVLSFSSTNENGVNWVDVKNNSTGSGPIISVLGSDTNIDLNVSSKGTGIVNITGNVTVSGTVDGRDLATDGTKLDTIETNAKDDQDLWETVAGDSGSTVANNSTKTLTIAGAGLISTAMSGDILTISTTATSNPSALDNIVEDLTPQLGANLDANTFDIEEEGNVVLSFTSGSEAAVNWVDVKNATTGVGPTIRSVGADTNVDLNISAKGAGIVNLGSGGVKLNANLDTNGNSIIRSGNIVLSFASFGEFAVNWIDVENADTGLGPTITVKGPDTNVDLNIEAKGLGRVNITNDSAVAGAFVNDALDTLDVAVTTIQGLHYLGAFVVASLPSAAANTNRLALATDAGGGRTLVISNGSDWHVFAVEGAIVTV